VADRLRHLPDLRLVVIGDGADRAQLVADCQQRGLDNVLFLPYQPREELSQSLSAAHASIVLQRENTLGLVVPSKLYGILAAGSAAIAAVPAQSEVARAITTHETGIVVPPGAADQIAAAAERLYRDRELCARLGCNARQAAERFFSRAAGAAQFCAVFERLAGNAAMPAAGATVDRKEDRAVARAG
jgi:colanic acid biosynthesis glycosyl transferase WcaI